MRAVLDANVLIAAVISPLGPLAALLDAWRRGELELVVSEQLLVELAGVLRRPRFRRWIAPDDVDALVLHFRRRGLFYADKTPPAPVAKDPKHDYLVALARTSNADALVTGDAALRQTVAHGVTILSPREFIDHDVFRRATGGGRTARP